MIAEWFKTSKGIPMNEMNPSPFEKTPASTAPPAPASSPAAERRLRLWPGVAIVILMWLAILGPGWLSTYVELDPEVQMQIQFTTFFFGGTAGLLAVALWWLFFSRLGMWDRLLGVAAYVAFGAITMAVADPSFGIFPVMIFALRAVTTAWVVWLVVTPFLAWPVRRVGMLLVMMAAWGYFGLLCFDGVTGNITAEMRWRWVEPAEAKATAARAAEMAKGNAAGDAVDNPNEVLVLQPGDWPAFRGANRDGRLTGVKIAVDWDKRQPRKLWSKLVGPGWSSFAVIGKRVYTQEQWENEEAVVCWDADTGNLLWSHRDPGRFTEAVGGIGPRATPTFQDGKIYALGAKGKLNCLDAVTGKVVWAKDIAADAGAEVPIWGFASSPLVTHGAVIVFAGGKGGKSVLAYNASSGDVQWYGGEGLLSYCSPQLSKLGGTEQVLISTDAGLLAFKPDGGALLWKYEWATEQTARIVQPTIVGETDVLLGTGMGQGMRRLKLNISNGNWSEEVVWKSRAMSPYYNDAVLYQDNLYGFDGEYLTCVSLKDGKSKWKERGYGNGQVLLLADQGLLLVLSEQGDVALVDASPDKHNERGRFHAINGKTWNHPVVAHGKLFVRNGEEAACFQLEEVK
jgi:outer membrane protein assembly factor BamB